MEIDEPCPHCGEAVIEEDSDGKYWCPACGSTFDREDIDDVIEFDEDDER